MINKTTALIFILAAAVVVLVALLLPPVHAAVLHGKNPNNLLSLATKYDPDETRASVISFEPLRDSMQKFMAENQLDAAIYVVNLRNGVNFGINENVGAFPASLNKVPVAIVAMREVEQGNLRLDSPISINPGKVKSNSVEISANSGIINISPISADIYKNNKELSLRTLLELMLKESDNDALRMILTQIDYEDLLAFYNYVDVDAYGSYDYVSSNASNRLLSAKALSNVFLSLYHSTILEPKDSQYLLSLLTETNLDARKLAQLPEYVKIAHKFGIYDDADQNHLFRDCGIIYSGKSRILYCVVIKGQQKEQAIAMTGRMIRAIYSYIIDNDITLDVYKSRNRDRQI